MTTPAKYLKIIFPFFNTKRTQEIFRINPTVIPTREEAKDIIIYVYDYNATTLNESSLTTIEQCFSYKDNNNVSWINIDGIRKAEVEAVCNHYGIHYLLFGEQGSFKFIRITQTFLFALAAIAFLLAVFYFTQNKRVAWLSYFLFGFNPTLISYTFYTITESLAPALVGFMLYFLARAYRYKSNKDWFIAGILFSIASLCRPTIFIFGGAVAVMIFLLYLKNIKAMLQAGLSFGIAVLLLFTPYLIRNYKVTNGDFVLLEKYYNDPMNYGMQNIELRKWISTWINPAEYNSERISNKMIENVQRKQTKNC